MNQTLLKGKNKPLTLRAIFILNALKIALSLGLFVAFKYYGLSVGDLNGANGATIILYTTIGYVITFATLVVSILKRNILTARLAIVADIFISLPAKALIGIFVALISIALTLTGAVKAYFNYRENDQSAAVPG